LLADEFAEPGREDARDVVAATAGRGGHNEAHWTIRESRRARHSAMHASAQRDRQGQPMAPLRHAPPLCKRDVCIARFYSRAPVAARRRLVTPRIFPAQCGMHCTWIAAAANRQFTQ